MATVTGYGLNFSSAEGLRDVRPTMPYPGWPWFVDWLLAILLVAAVGVGVFYFMKKKKRDLPPPPPDPYGVALRAIGQLAKDMQIESYQKFYVLLSEVIRRYFEDQFLIKAVEMTTEEFLCSFKTRSEFSAETKEMLEVFLTDCDMIKFAKFKPALNEMRTHLEHARQIVLLSKPEVS